MQNAGGVHGPVWETHGQGIAISLWEGFLMDPTISRIHVSFCALLESYLSHPSLFQPPSHVTHGLLFWVE